MKTRSLWWMVLSLCGAVACSAPEAIPDFRYYRLAPAAPVVAQPQPLLDRPLVLADFRADGVHGERPILYANDPDSLKLSQYHYQLWNDPPPVLVQRRFQQILGAAQVAPLVTDRLASRVLTYRLHVAVYRFERVMVEGQAAEAVVGLRLRIDADGADLPLLERDELVRVPVSGNSVEDSAVALSAGIDQIAQRLITALKARKSAA
jgi:ABC-type uncharacterized transport system auxiliary subunit